MQIPIIVQTDLLLSNYCTLNIGGAARYFASPSNEAEIIELVNWVNIEQIPYFVIGHGSNILFDDNGYPGLVIKLAENFAQIEINDEILMAQSGAWMPYVARKTQVEGLAGLEHSVGIPGNIGGIVTMNAGSQRKSVSTSLVKIRYLDENAQIHEIQAQDCNFSYRKSIFQLNKWIILQAEFRLSRGDKNQIRKTMRLILQERRLKFPRKLPNCGSVFKSDPVMYKKHGTPGRIIELLGLKGYQIGGMCISNRHANFFINQKNATSQDFKKMLSLVKLKAKSQMGVDLEEEVINANIEEDFKNG